MIIANQKGRYGNTLAVFDRDLTTGMLLLSMHNGSGNVYPVPDPQCIDWVPMPTAVTTTTVADSVDDTP